MGGGSYGYNPAEYRNDFSWIGEMGGIIAKNVHAMPQLLEMNSQIKENKYFKEKAYTAVQDYLKGMDGGIATKIASFMGIEHADANDAKQKLMNTVDDPTKYGDKTTNEEYANKLAHGFFVPFVSALKSEKGGGVKSIGEALKNLQDGVVQQAIKSTDTYKEIAGEENDVRKWEQTKQREAEAHTLGQDRSLGQKGVDGKRTGGSLEEGTKRTSEINDGIEARNTAKIASLKKTVLSDSGIVKANPNTTTPTEYRKMMNKLSSELLEGDFDVKNEIVRNGFDTWVNTEINRFTDEYNNIRALAAKEADARQARQWRQEEAADPTTKGEVQVRQMGIAQQKINSLLDEIKKKETQLGKETDKKIKTKLAQEISNLKGDVAFANTRVGAIGGQLENFDGMTQPGGYSTKVSTMSMAGIEPRAIEAITNNKLTIDAYRGRLAQTNTDKNLITSKEKMLKVLESINSDSKTGDAGYMFEVVSAKDPKSGKEVYQINLKQPYSKFKKYLTEGYDGSLDDPRNVTNIDKQMTLKQTQSEPTTFQQRKAAVVNLLGGDPAKLATAISRVKAANPKMSDDAAIEAIYEKTRSVK